MTNLNFLENLKKAVDTGEFNSDAAKKIKEIAELAEEKIGNADALLKKRLEDSGVRTVSEEEAVQLNSEYEMKMEDIKKRDAINKNVATLIEIEDMVKLSIEDMFSFMDELENKFSKEIEAQDPYFIDLTQQIGKIKSKYNFIINN